METQTEERRRPDTVVTSENLAEYQSKKLDLADIVTNPPKEEKEEPKVEAKEEKVEEVVPLELESEEIDKDTQKVLKKTKTKLEQRFSELTKERKDAISAREAAERRVAELEEKLKPVPVVDENAKPDKDKYTDAFLYAEDLAKWAGKQAVKDKEESDRKNLRDKESQEKVEAWNDRLKKAKKDNPDFEDKISNSSVKISNEIQEAIIESEIGPTLLLHLAENPEEAEKIGKMTVGRALIALGKLEARLDAPKKTEKREENEEVEVSRAPPPISPLKGSNAPVGLPVNARGEWTGSLDEYKEARRSGKIK